MIADDVALSSTTQHSTQTLINFPGNDASRRGYIFSESKSKVQTCLSVTSPITLNGNTLEPLHEEVHLGINHRTDLSNKITIEACANTGRKSVYKLAG